MWTTIWVRLSCSPSGLSGAARWSSTVGRRCAAPRRATSTPCRLGKRHWVEAFHGERYSVVLYTKAADLAQHPQHARRRVPPLENSLPADRTQSRVFPVPPTAVALRAAAVGATRDTAGFETRGGP